MSVTLLCPACGRPVTLRGDADEANCPQCSAPIPAPLLHAADAELGARKPGLIRLLGALFTLWVVCVIISALLMLFAGGLRYTFNGESVTRDVFMQRMQPVFAMLMVIVPAVSAAAWALQRERPWGRHVVMALVCLLALSPMARSPARPGPAVPVPVIAATLAHVAAAAWYFYRKRNVVHYYRQLQSRA